MIINLWCLLVFAKSDPEILESKKCSTAFSYFERKNKIPKDILYSISLHETQKAHSKHGIGMPWPWTVTVNPGGRGYHFANQREAVKFVQKQIKQGNGNIDVGCMQINLKYHPDAFSSIEQAFSPRRNIAYGAKFLKEKYNQHKDWDKAIGAYHSSSIERSFIYSSMIKKISNSIDIHKNHFASLSKFDYKTPKKLEIKEKKAPKFLGMKNYSMGKKNIDKNNLFRASESSTN